MILNMGYNITPIPLKYDTYNDIYNDTNATVGVYSLIKEKGIIAEKELLNIFKTKKSKTPKSRDGFSPPSIKRAIHKLFYEDKVIIKLKGSQLDKYAIKPKDNRIIYLADKEIEEQQGFINTILDSLNSDDESILTIALNDLNNRTYLIRTRAQLDKIVNLITKKDFNHKDGYLRALEIIKNKLQQGLLPSAENIKPLTEALSKKYRQIFNKI